MNSVWLKDIRVFAKVRSKSVPPETFLGRKMHIFSSVLPQRSQLQLRPTLQAQKNYVLRKRGVQSPQGFAQWWHFPVTFGLLVVKSASRTSDWSCALLARKRNLKWDLSSTTGSRFKSLRHKNRSECSLPHCLTTIFFLLLLAPLHLKNASRTATVKSGGGLERLPRDPDKNSLNHTDGLLPR